MGDTTAIDLGLGFGWSIVLFGVLTRPLGASVADWLGQPPSSGGIGWGDGPVFGVGLALV
ncbi:MAG: hypothetical protein ABIQ59_14405 [Nocardioidaceae bacterium]